MVVDRDTRGEAVRSSVRPLGLVQDRIISFSPVSICTTPTTQNVAPPSKWFRESHYPFSEGLDWE